MGLTHVAVSLRKFGSEESYTADFLVDTGALDSMVPSSELRKLGIEPVQKALYELASGELKEYEIGFAELAFLGSSTPSQVMFGPDGAEPILGVIAFQAAGFMVDPVGERLRKLRARPLKAIALKSVA